MTDYNQRKYDIGKYIDAHFFFSHCDIDPSFIVVFGATGFTGELTCEYLAEIKDDVITLV